jgi:spore coat protein A, manganese oxidase
MPTSLLDPNSQTKFTNALPSPPVINATGGGNYTIYANQVDNFSMGLVDPNGQPLFTTVYSYQWLQPNGEFATGSLYGPTIVAASGVPIHVTWTNNLPPIDPSLLPIDNSIDKANVTEPGAIPIVTHLHGGHSQAASDGHPDAWFTRNNAETGPAYQTATYTYDNSQDAATLIYHDHALGYTPQNVYAGLGGFYLIRDANLNKLLTDQVLPSGANEIGMALQDHSFTADGKLYMPGRALDDPIPGTADTVADMLPPDYTGPLPTALPEFFGDFNLVNGMAWPKLDVVKGEYLFHYTNVSDSRFYDLQMSDPNVKVTLVGVDGGLLKNAMIISDGDGVAEAGEDIILAPGDRIDLVVDFSNATGDVILQNTGPAYEPFKGLGAASAGVVNAIPGVDPVGEVMKFSVDPIAQGFHSKLFDNAADLMPNVVLNPDFKPISEASSTNTRKVGLYENTDEFGRILPLLGTAENTIDINGNPVMAGALFFHMPTTETPLLGSTETWEIFNYTADAHPMHLHEVEYQVLGRFMMSQTDITGDGVVDQLDYTAAADLNHDGLVNDIGSALALRPEETGSQDTSWVGPGEVLKIIQKFDLPGDYVWHCHILSHENNEMMRPLHVINTVDGTDKRDNLNGTADIDSITGGKGNDVANGGVGDDRFVAIKLDGNDRYDGGVGVDTLDLSRTTASAIVNLGSASDWTRSGIDGLAPIEGSVRALANDGGFSLDGFAAGLQIGFDKLTSIENVIGSSRSDWIVGNASDNLLAGGAGNDWINGRGGNDRIWGQDGNDNLRGGDGADTFLFYKDIATNKVDTGRDTIWDFDAKTDFLEVDKGMVTDFTTVAAFIANHAQDTRGGDVKITFDADNTIILKHTTVASLVANQDHFHFV